MLMFDSLNRHFLPNYGCDWTKAPNFKRLAEKTVTFDNSYVGSMPCMPARREFHTGRYNFLHRCWGPLEPFDDSMPQLLKNKGVYAHLVSDHYHYWEDGGSTYHTRYNSWEIVRGQEADPWKGEVKDPEMENPRIGRNNYMVRPYYVNRNQFMQDEEEYPQMKTFNLGFDFINTNKDADNWFLQIEVFDPHEPFLAHDKYKDLYPHEYDGPYFDWPEYKTVDETESQVKHLRYQYASLLSMCDHNLGRLLDLMDGNDMWEDTMLIVNTDHGFLLGEHGWFGKNLPPYYNEIARTPLFIWDPRCKKTGERRSALVQMIDMAPTLLEYFGVDIPRDMQGKSLKNTIAFDKPVREAALFGIFSGHIVCTDSKYVYMRSPATRENKPTYNYTLMPTHMFKFFEEKELKTAELVRPFSFTKGYKVLKIEYFGRPPQIGLLNHYDFGSMLFDVEKDPMQLEPINDDKVEKMMIEHMVRLMKENDSPEDQFVRVGLNKVMR